MLENRRVQAMLITINACFQGTAPTCIKELVKMRNNKHYLRGNNTLSLPNELRLKAGGLEFNKQVRNIEF